MINFIKRFKLVFILAGLLALLLAFIISAYLWLIPSMIASQKVQDFFTRQIYEKAGINVILKNFKLNTSKVPFVTLTADNFELSKNGNQIIVLKNIDSKVSLAQVKFKKVIINRLGADYIYVDVNKLLDIIPKTEKKEEKPLDWSVDVMNSIIYLKQLKVLYNINGVDFDIDTKNIEIDTSKGDKIPVKFDFSGKIKQDKYVVNLALKDNNKFYIKNKKLNIDDSQLSMNNSKVHLTGFLKDDKNYKLNVFAKGFDIKNIVALMESNTIVPNGAELLSFFDDIHGDFDFNFKVDSKGYEGKIDLHHLCFLFIPIENVPIHLHDGYVLVGRKDLHLKGFSGYYGTKKVNSIKFAGEIKDYMHKFLMNITADGIVSDDFAKYYLTPVVGIPLNIVGKADTRLIVTSEKGKYFLKWFFRMTENDNLLVSGEPISPYKERRFIASNMIVDGFLLRIKNLDYYVTVPGVAEWYRRKLISLRGLIDFAKGVDFRAMGFEIEKPVPSQFLNIIMRQNLLKEGTVVGKMMAVDGPKGVKLFGDLTLEKVKVPSQRLYIASARVNTDFNKINIESKGGYRRSHYEVTGDIFNNIAFPIIVNNIDFTLDNMDILKIVESFNQQGDGQTKSAISEDVSDDMPTFDMTNLQIKNCKFNLNKGTYGVLSVENVKANLTLDEKGELDLNSNKFDFAEGTTSCHVCCDLKNHKYHAKLGVRDVNSDLIATALLNLPKEISGKSSGIIDVTTDETMKMNGNIKFLVKDGTIGKIGLIEYVLNVASVFRNPLAMVSPLTIFDLMNIPNGKFDKIQGSLDIKDNIVENIKIKSYAPYLSAYIAGRYDMFKHDATLRIYTKMTNKKKGIYGILREISLGNIASRVSLGARNDVIYYSSEISELPDIEGDDKDAQIFVTRVDGDVENNNFLSSLKKLK